MRRPALAFLFLAAGCAAVPPEHAGEAAPAEPVVPAEGGAAECDANRTKHLIGRPQAEEVGAEALRLSGARALRWIRPGMVVTMDYRVDRLNIHLDGSGKVIDLRCG